MQISQYGFVFKTAYLFTSPDKRPVGYINGCSLIWRFIFYGLVRLIFDLVALPIILVVLSAIVLVRWPMGILFGNKLVLHQETDPYEEYEDWEGILLNYVWPPNWKWITIKSWPRIFGWRILPIGVVGVLAAGSFVGLIVFMNWVLGGMAAQGDSSALIMLIGEMVIGIGILAAFQQSAIRQSSVGQLVSTNMRSFKDRTCPVVRVVD